MCSASLWFENKISRERGGECGKYIYNTLQDIDDFKSFNLSIYILYKNPLNLAYRKFNQIMCRLPVYKI